jgi:outer membrane protein assembly factor BamB
MTTSIRLAVAAAAVAVLAHPARAQDKVRQIPLTRVAWSRPLLLDRPVDEGDPDPGKEAKGWIDKALDQRGEGPIVPGFRPVIVGELLVYRTHLDARALYLAPTGKFKAGDIHWAGTWSDGGLVALTSGAVLRFPAEKLLREMAPAELATLLVENSLALALSADDKRVYWVDDLAVPPPLGAEDRKLGETWKALITQNALWAMDLDTGKIRWRVGRGKAGEDPLAGSFFLHAPLPIGGKLHVLNESSAGELRLLVLNPDDGSETAKVVIETVDDANRLLAFRQRRQHAANLVAADNLFIACAHSGKVFAVDLANNKVEWTHEYRKEPPGDPAKPLPMGWKTPGLFVADGKVVFAAADDDFVRCIDLKGGKPLWKVRRGGCVYLAGIHGNNAVLVGDGFCRGLALKDGKQAWQADTGTPSGMGVFRKNVFLLPLKHGLATKGPEIAHVDVEKGILVGTSPLKETPGNLALHGDLIVSQSATTITAYAAKQVGSRQ